MTAYDFCEDNLDSFLKEFDSVREKYSIGNDSACYSDAWKYENVSMPVNYSKNDSASFIESMCMVYGCDELEANKALWRCKTISDKFLNQFIHIDGISRLFNEHYIEFEWDMHSRMNFDVHEISYYRDHFFHQLRNCYMLDKLLKDSDVFHKVESILLNETESKVSRFFSESMQKLTYNIRDEHRLKDVLKRIAAEKTFSGLINESIRDYKGEYISSIKNEILKFFITYIKQVHSPDLSILKDDINYLFGLSNDSKRELDNILNYINRNIDWQNKRTTFNQKYDEEVKNYYSRYIIKSSAYIAALFHDIGYPVAHYFVIQKRLLGFSPPIYMLINGDKSSYEKIVAKLSQSLLFQLVDKKEIIQRCESGDHGTLSAIIFLLHFYESGLIFSLPIEQKTSIEIAALAIYNHTNKYESILGEDKHSECHYQRAIFKLNPISFLLRLCDDAQEWSRTYFEISNTASLIYCNNCYTPLIRKKENNKYQYKCFCGKGGKLKNAYFKNENTDFKRRLIYNVNTCKSLQLNINDTEIVFDFKYDYFRLLRMCSLGTSYAFQRIKELNYIKRLVIGQNIGKKVRINYIMSCNPVFLKSLIIGKYIEKYKMDFIPKNVLSNLGIQNVDSNLRRRWEKQLKFYYNIYLKGQRNSQNSYVRLLNTIKNEKLKQIVKKLSEDALLRYEDMKDMIDNYSSARYLDKYMKSDKSLKFDIDVYCDPENEINCGSHDYENGLFPDYYSDLYIFELLNEALIESKTN